jgi:hypothetical protein
MFRRGLIPWNKGTHFCSGGGSIKTRFKPGQASPRWNMEFFCVGALRINSNGELEIKLAPGSRGWYTFSRHVWETERGPIPPGWVVRFRNGDRHDARIENLYLARRADVMRENTVHNYPQPLRRAIHLRAVLQRVINRRLKDV